MKSVQVQSLMNCPHTSMPTTIVTSNKFANAPAASGRAWLAAPGSNCRAPTQCTPRRACSGSRLRIGTCVSLKTDGTAVPATRAPRCIVGAPLEIYCTNQTFIMYGHTTWRYIHLRKPRINFKYIASIIQTTYILTIGLSTLHRPHQPHQPHQRTAESPHYGILFHLIGTIPVKM